MKTITNIVYNFVRKQLAKNNMGQGKGITSLPNAADIEIGMTDVYNNLRKGGLDAVSAGKAIKSEDDLARTLSEIKQKEISDQQFFNQDPNRLDIIIDKMNKGKPLNEGDRFALEGSGFETKLDAFKGFEPKVIQGGKSEKELLEKMNKQNKEAVERIKKRKDTDPDKKAEGGRIGYFRGGVAALLKLIQSKVGKKAITTADKIDRPESAKLRDEFEAFEKRIGNRKLTDEEYAELQEIYGDGLPLNLETVGDAEKFVAEQKAYEAAMARDYRAGKLDPKPGEPGRKRFLEKMKEEAEMSGDKRLFTKDEADELMMLEASSPANVESALGAKKYGGIENANIPIELMTVDIIKAKYPGITDELAELIGNDTNLQRKAEALAEIERAMALKDAGKSADETIAILKGEPETKMSKGGLARILEM